MMILLARREMNQVTSVVFCPLNQRCVITPHHDYISIQSMETHRASVMYQAVLSAGVDE